MLQTRERTDDARADFVDEGLIDEVIAEILLRTGVDFSRYRRPTVRRRIGNRMISLGEASLELYLDRLRNDIGEAARLLERLTIKVSRFYRNAPAYDSLAHRLLPEMAFARGGRPLRIWSAGCGCGEEAYTLAMLLEDAGLAGSIDATDIDPESLRAAAEGLYRPEALAELPAELADHFLRPVRHEGSLRFRVEDVLRRRVRFSIHDLTGELSPPEARFDLVSCRNLLIYLRPAAQQRAFERLIGAMDEGALLHLGEAEWPLPEIADRLIPLEQRTRLFRLRSKGKR